MKIDNIERSLADNGYCILKDIFNTSQLQNYRKTFFKHLDLFPNTRPSPHARHLAGFHRYGELVSIHSEILSNDRIKAFLKLIGDQERWISIGLTDITINRSQQWHTDLLRGKYEHYLSSDTVYGVHGGGVYKILVYAQKGKNLKVIPGSHKVFSPLNDTASKGFAAKSNIKTLEIDQGDVIIMDVRLQHKGADENEMSSKELNNDAKVLISTVVGAASKQLTYQMMVGNAYRQVDWDKKHLSYFSNQIGFQRLQ